MAKTTFSVKQLLINKANAQMMIMIAGSAIIVVFSLVSSRALLIQRSYQSRVISEKEKALKQLKSNVTAVSSLVKSYDQFESATENVLGGSPSGGGEKDGDNARVVLDALPSQYDFPALVSSLEKILSDPSYKIGAISGVDDELNQTKNTSSPVPQPVEMPFSIDVSGAYASVQNLISTLSHSIRPIQIQTIDMSGKDSDMHVTIGALTYYQPEKNLTIRTKEIK